MNTNEGVTNEYESARDFGFQIYKAFKSTNADFTVFMNNPEEHFHIYLMHSRIEDDEIIDIESFTDRYGRKAN